MIETVRTWFHDWSDACEYANECAPDLSFLAQNEPNACLLLTVVIALAFWGFNKWWVEEPRCVGAQAFDYRGHQTFTQKLLSPLTFGDTATVSFVSAVGALSDISGVRFLLFPELGALSHDIFRRPQGVWANAPSMLILTPFFAGLVGTLLTQYLPYGLVSICVTIIAGILIVRLLGSPITPAISAGLLPLTLGETSWWYSPSLLFGTGLLICFTTIRRRFFHKLLGGSEPKSDLRLDAKWAGHDRSWLPFFSVFIFLVACGASLTGIRFLMFPPLAVIAFEMFAHASICPWAHRPLVLPVVCSLTAVAGITIVAWLGTGAVAVALTIISGAVVLRTFALHAPPAIAVGLLPFVMPNPEYRYGLAVAVTTSLLSLSFLFWRWMTPAME